ncbi:rhodanese-like domain-containing protein [Sideroxydans lithotrophicus]|uniref:Rhodanese domain protein n=1 Tax=Sideroxydans lithotrophicus (strain ES-1) TaxID=580332 RepID=D5CPS1_SIDLE|nr:rhodanese-like domain-containing protein [Sideroxydans lithotrophicus]ADE13066.1 Rhodanese domain protein [Sideroxydans lithotrophicus ES-1]
MYGSINLRQTLIALSVIFLAGIWMANVNSHHYDIKNVTISEADSLIKAGALVIDVRDQDKFNFRHIPGAILIPLEVLRAGIPLSLAAFKSRPIVIYCNEGLSHGPEGTAILQKAGFAKAVNLESGIEGWAKSGMPIQRG